MGILFKFILFGLVFYYILKTVGSFIFRIFGGQVQQKSRPTAQPQYRKEGEINIDSVPKGKNRKQNGDAKDGDYIDFEEVK